MSEAITHTAPLWRWTGENNGSWHFVTIGGEAGEAIAAHEAMRRLELGHRRGFGSVRVTARIGTSEWRTSVFPSKAEGGWLLPVKAAVRKAEGLAEGDAVSVTLTLT
ncbi:MAG: DUF1905 domain-containing protein [Sphingomonadales bacterium]|nr:DUF1905 domain-containing protein [Sphingomonadales bacterium]MBD3775460.1 DUF1905 domain-containing protein [Paracoccaceae bacterium]